MTPYKCSKCGGPVRPNIDGDLRHHAPFRAALQQPDTSEAVPVLVAAARHYQKRHEIAAVNAEGLATDWIGPATTALQHPAVIAAMKGVDHG